MSDYEMIRIAGDHQYEDESGFACPAIEVSIGHPSTGARLELRQEGEELLVTIGQLSAIAQAAADLGWDLPL